MRTFLTGTMVSCLVRGYKTAIMPRSHTVPKGNSNLNLTMFVTLYLRGKASTASTKHSVWKTPAPASTPKVSRGSIVGLGSPTLFWLLLSKYNISRALWLLGLSPPPAVLRGLRGRRASTKFWRLWKATKWHLVPHENHEVGDPKEISDHLFLKFFGCAASKRGLNWLRSAGLEV